MGFANLRIGCCGWTEAQARYLQHFPVIELQTTFYEPPTARLAARWRSLAPADFHFCMKAWQLITHTPSSPTYRRLKSQISAREHSLYGNFRATEQVWLAWERTREIARVLDAKVVVFQCPKSFLPTTANLRNIKTFFRDIDRDGRIMAWEPRGADWTDEIVRRVCQENGLLHVVDPFERSSVSTNALYWRLHGRAGYRYRYTDDDLAELQQMLDMRRDTPGPLYILFNNMYCTPDALRFIGRLPA